MMWKIHYSGLARAVALVVLLVVGRVCELPVQADDPERYVDIMGYMNEGTGTVSAEVFWPLVSTHTNYQIVHLVEIGYYPSNPAVAEIITDNLGARRLHLVYDEIHTGDTVIAADSFDYQSTGWPSPAGSGWETLPVPTNADVYPTNIQVFLKAGEMIELNDVISNYADSVTSATIYRDVICDIVTELGTWSTCATSGPQKTALETYYAGCSVCTERARLCVAMLRSKNIPARTASKYEIKPTHHTWTQAYIDGYGWVDVDPYFGTCPKSYPEIILIIDDTQEDSGPELISRPPSHFRLLTTNEMNYWLSGPDNDGDRVPDTLDPDDDNDDMPDLWEIEYGLSPTNFNGGRTNDADGDHSCDLDEYIAATIPTNPESFFRVESISSSSSNCVLSFLSATDRFYAVEYSPELLPVTWLSLTSNITGTGDPIDIPLPTNAPHHFYRINVCQ